VAVGSIPADEKEHDPEPDRDQQPEVVSSKDREPDQAEEKPDPPETRTFAVQKEKTHGQDPGREHHEEVERESKASAEPGRPSEKGTQHGAGRDQKHELPDGVIQWIGEA
jgi:hypothetical protein